MSNTSTAKVVQFFLTADEELPAVYEVRIIKETKALICTCPGYKGRSLCKHIRYVRSKLITGEDDKNHYVLRLDEDTPEDMIDNVVEMSVEEYRNFVAKYGLIEVL